MFQDPAPLFYRTEIRATGVGTAVAVGRLGAMSGPLLAGKMLALGAGTGGVMAAAAPGTTIVDSSTNSPAMTHTIRQALRCSAPLMGKGEPAVVGRWFGVFAFFRHDRGVQFRGCSPIQERLSPPLGRR